jgi:hypothetical protein
MDNNFQQQQGEDARDYGDLDRIGRNRRISLNSIEDLLLEDDANGDASWDVVDDNELVDDADSYKIVAAMRESDTAKELLKIAACLGSLDKRLLQASTRTRIDEHLENAKAKGLVMYDSQKEYLFASNTMQSALY